MQLLVGRICQPEGIRLVGLGRKLRVWPRSPKISARVTESREASMGGELGGADIAVLGLSPVREFCVEQLCIVMLGDAN